MSPGKYVVEVLPLEGLGCPQMARLSTSSAPMVCLNSTQGISVNIATWRIGSLDHPATYIASGTQS